MLIIEDVNSSVDLKNMKRVFVISLFISGAESAAHSVSAEVECG
jgi:hypothetical protein